MTLDRRYLLASMGYALFGMCVGIYMAASRNHAQHVSHAHILLVGFVVSLIYALFHRLWLAATGALGAIQFYLHQGSALGMCLGLLLLYGGRLDPAVEAMLGVASVGVLAAAVLMVYLLVRHPQREARAPMAGDTLALRAA